MGQEAAGPVFEEAMRALVLRTGDGELTVGAALAATAALRAAADAKLVELVGFAREAGASWAAIGEALGVTAQAAHQRFRSSAPPGPRAAGAPARDK